MDDRIEVLLEKFVVMLDGPVVEIFSRDSDYSTRWHVCQVRATAKGKGDQTHYQIGVMVSDVFINSVKVKVSGDDQAKVEALLIEAKARRDARLGANDS